MRQSAAIVLGVVIGAVAGILIGYALGFFLRAGGGKQQGSPSHRLRRPRTARAEVVRLQEEAAAAATRAREAYEEFSRASP